MSARSDESPADVPALSCAHVDFSYDGAPILTDVSLDIPHGAFLAVVGPNGAGKTTLVRLLCGLLSPDRGVVCLDGHPLQAVPVLERARRIALVPQREPPVFPFSVRSTVALGRYPHQGGWGFETERDRLAVTRVLDTLSLGPLADRSITELSGGELHRVLIARALAQETDVLVLDEPNAHLDLRHQAQIFDLLHHLHTNGRTVVCVTHDLSLAATYARTAAVLSGGRIAAHGPAEEVIVPEVVSRYFDVRATVDRHGDAVSVGFIPDRTASDSTSKGV